MFSNIKGLNRSNNVTDEGGIEIYSIHPYMGVNKERKLYCEITKLFFSINYVSG